MPKHLDWRLVIFAVSVFLLYRVSLWVSFFFYVYIVLKVFKSILRTSQYFLPKGRIDVSSEALNDLQGFSHIKSYTPRCLTKLRSLTFTLFLPPAVISCCKHYIMITARAKSSAIVYICVTWQALTPNSWILKFLASGLEILQSCDPRSRDKKCQ